MSKSRKRSAVKPLGDWGRFVHERHLLIVDWVRGGQTFDEIARALSMDPVQVQLISMTPLEPVEPTR